MSGIRAGLVSFLYTIVIAVCSAEAIDDDWPATKNYCYKNTTQPSVYTINYSGDRPPKLLCKGNGCHYR